MCVYIYIACAEKGKTSSAEDGAHAMHACVGRDVCGCNVGNCIQIACLPHTMCCERKFGFGLCGSLVLKLAPKMQHAQVHAYPNA